MNEVIIDRLNHQGKGICLVDGKVVFVDNALPSERVSICIDKVNRKFCLASVSRYIVKSDSRVVPECPYYGLCGGCDIMHMSYGYQHDFKFNKVLDIVRKFVKDDIVVNDIIYGDQFGYRNKTTFHVKEKIGFYKEKTYDLIGINNCLISSLEINDILSILSKMDLSNIDSVVIRSSYDNKKVMVILNIVAKINESMFIERLKDDVSSIYVNDKGYRLIFGEEFIIDKIGDLRFVISPGSFFQVNTSMAFQLYSIVKNYVGSACKLLDLYCGTGTIGLFLADVCKEVIGVELNSSAIHDANVNRKLNNIDNVRFICGDSGRVLRELNYKPDVIVVDPPRSGLDGLAINEVIGLRPSKIVYVSCDPVTLARDLNILKEFYSIREISLVDMFPNTHHVECVCVLSLR